MKKIILIALLIATSFYLQSCSEDEEPELNIPILGIGDFHEGGVIFYLDETGEHGFVCAIIDQSFNATWGCPPLVVIGADGVELSTGAQNTTDIINTCDTVGIAAELCDRMTLNDFTDWFLPSRDELDALYQNLDKVNEGILENEGTELEDTEYWSSSHQTSNTVYVQHFSAGNQFGAYEDALYNVRAIRAF